MSKNIRVGITHGDINGIGYEVIIKALDDERITELLTPVIFGSEKALNYYRRALGREEFRVRRVRNARDADDEAVNLVDCVEGDVRVEPGQPSETAGRAAFLSLDAACRALENGEIDVLVTAPINKATIHSDEFNFPGHTEYLESRFAGEGEHALMILFNETVRVALVTIHIPVSEIAAAVTAESVTATVRRLNDSLRRDFRIERPRIAVLGLNPHCGDSGVIGKEDDAVITPALETLRHDGILAFGPFAADGFFGSGSFRRFDGVVAMYHDQGLAPFKTLAGAEGVNFTAGLKYVRTSPDHGTGFDIAGKNEADPASMRRAIFDAIDIFRARRDYDFARRNPLRPLPPERDRKDSKDKDAKDVSTKEKEQKDTPAKEAPFKEQNDAPAKESTEEKN